MARYRRKPGFIEAVQYFARDGHPAVKFNEPDENGIACFSVESLQGPVAVNSGDFIITEPDGIHHYPCRPDVFHERYELDELER